MFCKWQGFKADCVRAVCLNFFQFFISNFGTVNNFEKFELKNGKWGEPAGYVVGPGSVWGMVSLDKVTFPY